VADAHRKL